MKPYCLEDLSLAGFDPKKDIEGKSVIVTRSNFGCGSSREHAALVPMYLGVRGVIAKSFARIHVANLINAGILPLTFKNPEDYDWVAQGAKLTFTDIRASMACGELVITDEESGRSFVGICDLTERQQNILLAGGLLNYTKNGGQ